MNLDNLISGLQTNKTTPEHRILGGIAVAFILGPIMAFIVIMLYGAWCS
jgi:hypothetical protein